MQSVAVNLFDDHWLIHKQNKNKVLSLHVQLYTNHFVIK